MPKRPREGQASPRLVPLTSPALRPADPGLPPQSAFAQTEEQRLAFASAVLERVDFATLKDGQLQTWLLHVPHWVELLKERRGAGDALLHLSVTVATVPWARLKPGSMKTRQVGEAFEKACISLGSLHGMFVSPTVEAALRPFAPEPSHAVAYGTSLATGSTCAAAAEVAVAAFEPPDVCRTLRILDAVAERFPDTVDGVMNAGLARHAPPPRWPIPAAHAAHTKLLLHAACAGELGLSSEPRRKPDASPATPAQAPSQPPARPAGQAFAAHREQFLALALNRLLDLDRAATTPVLTPGQVPDRDPGNLVASMDAAVHSAVCVLVRHESVAPHATPAPQQGQALAGAPFWHRGVIQFHLQCVLHGQQYARVQLLAPLLMLQSSGMAAEDFVHRCISHVAKHRWTNVAQRSAAALHLGPLTEALLVRPAVFRAAHPLPEEVRPAQDPAPGDAKGAVRRIAKLCRQLHETKAVAGNAKVAEALCASWSVLLAANAAGTDSDVAPPEELRAQYAANKPLVGEAATVRALYIPDVGPRREKSKRDHAKDHPKDHAKDKEHPKEDAAAKETAVPTLRS